MARSQEISIRTVASLGEVNPEAWDALSHGDSPFQRHGFLMALEDSASVGPETGWMPMYLLVSRGEELIGGAASYIKTDSYGEYIFDWAWARAAPQFGQRYYPKLVIAAPFTPATGPRLLYKSAKERELVYGALAAGIGGVVERFGLSSAHVLFCTEEEAAALESHGMARRASFQFHWHNRDYQSFDDFLSRLKSRKRKQIRKERRRARDAVDAIEFVPAREMTSEDLGALDRFYRKTVHEHGGFDYLQPGFFESASQRLPDTMLFARVTRGSAIVAGAVFFEGEKSLFGRYWGSNEDCEFLHFEVAYYAAIEHCIERGIELFEAGAQGEQKLLRGFEPALTHSVHHFADPRFGKAVSSFLEQEQHGVSQRMAELAQWGPYRCEDD